MRLLHSLILICGSEPTTISGMTLPLFCRCKPAGNFSPLLLRPSLTVNIVLISAGLPMYLNSENWLKASIEYENDDFQHLGSVVTNHGYSDWATTSIDASIKSMWYRLSRRNDDFRLDCSLDGKNFQRTMVNSQINCDRPIGLEARPDRIDMQFNSAQFQDFVFSI